MERDSKIEDLEKQLNDLKNERGRRKGFVERTRGSYRTAFLVFLTVLLLLAVAIPFGVFYYLQNGSTFQESKAAFVERLQGLNELSTAEAYSKVIIERQDNQLFGQDIGIDLPGTKRQLLVVIPGKVRAGINFDEVTEEDITVDEEARTAILTLPQPEILGEPELFLDQVEIYSYEGLFRDEANITEAYDLAEEAQALMLEEARGQGVLALAEENAEKSVQEMFGLVDYNVTVQFE